MNSAEAKKHIRKYPISRLVREYFSRAGRYRWFVPFHLVLVVIMALMQSAIPRASGILVDTIIKDPAAFAANLILPCFFSLVAICLFYYFLEYVQKIFSTRYGVEIKAEFQLDLYRHLLHLSEDFYQRTQVGEISTRLTRDMDNGVDPFYWMITQIVWASVLFTTSGFLLLTINRDLFFLFLAVFGLWMLGSRFFLIRARDMNRKLNDQWGELSGRITEGISSQALIRAYAKEQQREEELGKEVTEYLTRSLKLRKFTSAVFATVGTVLYYFLPLLILFFAGTVLKTKLSVGDVVSSYGIWLMAATPISALMWYFPRIVNCIASIDRVFEFFDETPLTSDLPGADKLMVSKGEIVLKEISFTYPLRDRKIVIENLDLTIKAQSRTAIVGSTGSGKSTIISLILRLYDPAHGSVTIDGSDLRSVSQQSIREQIGLVMQDTILWSGTIRENMQFAKPDATDDEITAALKHAELWDFVESTDKKIDTIIGEKGVRLSGGQKQRMAIARVFLLNPPIVILDEATSSLDTLTEKNIQHTMAGLFSGRTAIIIAHRLSTIMECESIVVLDKGKIIAQGTHEVLSRTCDQYRAMCMEQNLSIE